MSSFIVPMALTLAFAGFSKQAATMSHEWLRQQWGPNAARFVEAVAPYSVARHLDVFRSFQAKLDVFLPQALNAHVMEVYGDARVGVHLFMKQQSAIHDYTRAAPPPGMEVAFHFLFVPGFSVGREMDSIHAFRPAVLRLLAAFGCTGPADCVRWYEESQDWSLVRSKARSSKDLRHHMHPPDGNKALLQALMTLASAGRGTGSGMEAEVEMGWMDSLPAEDATTLYGCNSLCYMTVCSRSLVAECFEQRQSHQDETQGRRHGLESAMRWARANLSDAFNFNALDRAR